MTERQHQPSLEVQKRASIAAIKPELVRQRYVPDAATAQFIADANALVRRFGHANYDPSLVRAGRAS